jgi:hypothetical protein
MGLARRPLGTHRAHYSVMRQPSVPTPAGGCCIQGFASRFWPSPARCRSSFRSGHPARSVERRTRCGPELCSSDGSRFLAPAIADDCGWRDDESGCATAQAELRLGLRRTTRAVCVLARRCVGLVQKSIEFPAVMHTRVGHVVLPDQLVLGIRIHVVLAAVEALAVLFGPARVFAFLPAFRGFFSQSSRLLRRLGTSMIVHQPSGRRAQCSPRPPNAGQSARFSTRPAFASEPQRRAVRNAVLDAEPQKPRERQPVAHFMLDLFVGKILKRHQHPKHHHDVDRLATGGALHLAHRRQHRRLDLRTEGLERHHASNHFQRITLRGNRRKPPVHPRNVLP